MFFDNDTQHETWEGEGSLQTKQPPSLVPMENYIKSLVARKATDELIDKLTRLCLLSLLVSYNELAIVE